MGVLHCCIARLLWGAMGSRSNAIMSIRRGHELIHVFNHKTADDYLFHPADGQNQKVDCKIFSLATGVLDLLASHLGTDYKGLGQALKDHRRSLSPEVAKLVRGLHEAFGFVRHLTQVGEERILEAVRADLAASCPDPAATATAPCRSATTTPSARRTLCLERLLSPSSTPDCVLHVMAHGSLCQIRMLCHCSLRARKKTRVLTTLALCVVSLTWRLLQI